MKRKQIYAITAVAVILAISLNALGQSNVPNQEAEYQEPEYQEKIRTANDKTEFREIRQSAEQYFEGRDHGRGSGYKQYKRWEEFMMHRLDDDGTLLNYNAKLWQAQIWEIVKPQLPRLFNPMFGFGPAPSSHTGAGLGCTGPEWSLLGPTQYVNGNEGYNPGLGRINVIDFHPSDPETIYFGAPAGGLWKTTDGGSNWEALTDHLITLGVSGIEIDPTDPDHIFILTGDGDGRHTYTIGVLESEDGGSTWSTTGLSYSTSDIKRGYKLLMDPNDPDIMFAAMSDGLFRTEDGGANWTQVQFGSFRDVEFQPGNSDIMYATTSNQFFRSNDNGENWSSVSTALSGTNRIEIGVTPDDEEYVYLLSGPAPSTGRFTGISRSTDGGNSFSLRIDTPNILGYPTNGLDDRDQSRYDLAVAVNPDDAEEVITGGINIWKSTDGADTIENVTFWKPSGSAEYTHADIHELVYNPVDGKLYCGSDGGIFVSDDDGDTWTDISDGIVITQFYRIAGTEDNADLVVGGTQDNGSNLWQGSNTITHVWGADGMDCMIDYTDEDVLYYTSQNGGLRRSDDGGTNSQGIAPQNSSGPWITPYGMDPDDPTIIYGCWDTLFRSTNQGGNWTVSSSFMQCGNGLAICEDDGSVVYGASGGSVFRSNNSGTNNSNVSTGLPGRSITYIVVNPNDCDEAWVSMGGFNANQKVYRTVDGGMSWENMSAGLPNVPINCLFFVDETKNGGALGAVYAGTDIGVWYRDAGTPWTCVNEGLPKVPIRDLEINYDENIMRAGTFGRGLWEAEGILAKPPEAACHDTTLALDANGDLTLLPGDVDDGSAASKGIASLTVSPNTFDCDDVGDVTVTLTIEDNDGDTDACEATVTIVDETDPVIETPASDMTVECDGSGNVTEFNNWLSTQGGAAATDACGGTWSHDSEGLSDECGATGSETVSFTFTDPSGNTATTTATFTIEDTEAPSVTCPEDIHLPECEPVATWTVDATDECGSVSVVSDPPSGTEFAKGSTTTIDVTGTDECGNVSECSFIVERDPDLKVDIVPLETSPLNTCAFGTEANIVLGYGGGPDCITLEAVGSGGHESEPYTYSWEAPAAVPAANFTDANTATPTFCADFQTDPCVTYTFRVTVTDFHGCEETDEIQVNVLNASVFADGSQCAKPNNPKAVVCHDNGKSQKSLCLHPNGVSAHLGSNGKGHEGDCLGDCNAPCIFLLPASLKTGSMASSKFNGDDEAGKFSVKVSPNPFSNSTTIRVASRNDARVDLAVYDMSGRLVTDLYEGDLKKDISYYFDFDPGHLSAGVYFVRLIDDSGNTGHTRMVLVD